MMLEALVAFSCVNSYGCPQSFSSYMLYNKEFNAQTETNKNIVENYAGKTFIGLVIPVLSVAESKTLEVPVAPHIFFRINDKLDAAVTLSKTF